MEQKIFGGKLLLKLCDLKEDYVCMELVSVYIKIDYLKLDGKFSFDKFFLVYILNIYYEEDQLCYLKLIDMFIFIKQNLFCFDEFV